MTHSIAPTLTLAFALTLSLATGCASRSAASPPVSMTSASSVSSARREAELFREGPVLPGSVSVVAPTAIMPSNAGAVPTAMPRMPQPVESAPLDTEARREDAIARWQERFREANDAFGASLGTCRSICIAAGDVCTAAREICRLTGDLTVAQPRDARCARARMACLDAGRRRDGACPTCPPQ